MIRKLTFYCRDEESINVDRIAPATGCLPRYYLDVPAPTRSNPEFMESGGIKSNIRACVPYYDALTAGYIQRTWADIYINATDEGLSYHSANERVPILSHRPMRPEVAETLPDYWPVEMVWQGIWQPQTPDGYSLLVTHPMNRYDLPFSTASGIVDTDLFTLSAGYQGQVPFYLKRNFRGLIPYGTPMYQVIPIKRDLWQAEYESADSPKRPHTYSRVKQYFTGGYRRHFWQRKSYR